MTNARRKSASVPQRRTRSIRQCWLTGTAEYSPCQTYRYRLTRELVPLIDHVEVDPAGNPKRTVAFCMLNPSTATEEDDDPTIRRCIGYAQTWGYRRLIIVNAYGLRSTDPAGLKQVVDAIGPGNDAAIAQAARDAEITVAAWGNHIADGDPQRVTRLRELLGSRVYALRITKQNQPAHPVRLPKSLMPQPWR